MFASFLILLNFTYLVTLYDLYFSLKCSEDVQYFQFDKDGNMFVFKPGSGFSGPSVKVEPGFEIGECTQYSLFSNDQMLETENVLGASATVSQLLVHSDAKDTDIIPPTCDKR